MIQSAEPEQEGRESKASKASKAKRKKESNLTASVTTGKTTLGHRSVVEARDQAYQVILRTVNVIDVIGILLRKYVVM